MSQPDQIISGFVKRVFVQATRKWTTQINQIDIEDYLEEFEGKKIYMTIEVIE
ncbi:TPA_asm: hypothetical protein vir520_00031 [Caudoviricetes sp. vir520]|nr:TPA_asm: hypothetical protein vir520_00031 [Caudoviricetes sp. vir520]